jgi:hypothetical protein
MKSVFSLAALTFRRTFQTLLDKHAVAARDNLVWLAS